MFKSAILYFFYPLLCLKYYITKLFIYSLNNKNIILYLQNNFNIELFWNVELTINPFLNYYTSNILLIYYYIVNNNRYKEYCKKCLYWPNKKNIYMFLNSPREFLHDFLIKSDLLVTALKLPKNSCIIDGGAHIGDGAIPIAHALQHLGRSDIIVYAIEPSFTKCKFMEKISKINKIENIVILNYGLSKEVNKYSVIYNYKSKNTGGNKYKIDPDGIEFVNLDYLVEKNIIKNKIGIIHLDIEGFEYDALIGASNLLNKYKPYLSIENLGDNDQSYINVLPEGYNFHGKINLNEIYSVNKY